MNATDKPTTDNPTSRERIRAELFEHGRTGQRIVVDCLDREGRPLLVVGFVATCSSDRATIERSGGIFTVVLIDRITRLAPVSKGR